MRNLLPPVLGILAGLGASRPRAASKKPFTARTWALRGLRRKASSMAVSASPVWPKLNSNSATRVHANPKLGESWTAANVGLNGRAYTPAPLVTHRSRLGVLVAVAGEHDIGGDHVRSAKSLVDAGDFNETVDQQTGDDHQESAHAAFD